MQQLLKITRMKNHPIQQILKRLHEKSNAYLNYITKNDDTSNLICYFQHTLGPLAIN